MRRGEGGSGEGGRGVAGVGERGAATSTTVAGGLGDCSCAMRRPCTSSAAEVGFADSGHVGVGPPLDARDARTARTARTVPPPPAVAKQLLRQTQATVTPPRAPLYPTTRRHPPHCQRNATSPRRLAAGGAGGAASAGGAGGAHSTPTGKRTRG